MRSLFLGGWGLVPPRNDIAIDVDDYTSQPMNGFTVLMLEKVFWMACQHNGRLIVLLCCEMPCSAFAGCRLQLLSLLINHDLHLETDRILASIVCLISLRIRLSDQ